MRRLGGLWLHRDFRSLWGAETISQFGSQVTFLALPLVAIVTLDESAFRVALLTTAEFLPFLFFTLPAGVWVDRLPRRPILILANLGRAASLLSVPVAHWLGALTIWQLYAVGFAVGVGTVFFDLAYMSYLPRLVARAELVEGNAKLETSRSAAQVGGPGLGGLLVSALTAPVAIAVDAASYLASALLMGRIRTVEDVAPRDGRRSLRAELREGLGYVFRHPYQRGIVVAVAISNFFGQLVFAILLVFAVRELGLTAAAIGVILSLGSVGTLLAAVTARPIGDRLGVGRTILVAAFLFGPGTLLIAVAPADYAEAFIVAAIAIIGYGGTLFNVTMISLVQAITPDRILGRANASRRFVVWGVIPLGGVASGVLAETIGLRETIVVGSLGALLAVVPILASPIRSLGRMSEIADQSSPIASASSAPA
ncbi:MAG: MFS transporter [Gaiellaceae bacterium]